MMTSKTSAQILMLCSLWLFLCNANAQNQVLVSKDDESLASHSYGVQTSVLYVNVLKNKDSQTSLSVNVVGAADIKRSEQSIGAHIHKPISKIFWGLAFAIAFLGIVKRRLAR